MPTDIASNARIRDRQRRSRANRKKRIEDGERRLKEYESKGAKVIPEIEEAARCALKTNRRLWQIVTLHGLDAGIMCSRAETSRDEKIAQPQTSGAEENSQQVCGLTNFSTRLQESMVQKSWDEEALQLQPPWGEEFPSKKIWNYSANSLAAVNSNAYVHGNHRAPPPRTGRRKALFIGINYFGQLGHLKHCINNAKNMSLHLFENYGYKREDTVILTDDLHNPMSQPTKQNILIAMHWLVKGATLNDSLFFYYSGHGGQTKVLDGSYDDAIYPVDFREVGHIVSDEMHRVMVTALCLGVHLTTIVDSCHSNSDSGSCSAELLNFQAVNSNIMNLFPPLLQPPLSYQTPASDKDYGDSNSSLGQTQALNLPFPLSPFHTTTTTAGQPS
ncbi:hypothetical protein V501_01016 [Pseudogymnoascus sp. VKM F-4519 (FW-2642)]|nr:hypothetical protein V501_01016 [Pseudogymnoascus sp. VKM F-4519 (FW-2642)]